MDLFYKPHKDILQKMLFFNVEFIMIGGYAVNYQGFSRPTGDLELWIKPTNDNKEKLLEMLKVNKFNKESIGNATYFDNIKVLKFRSSTA
jgi:hypothetical protein